MTSGDLEHRPVMCKDPQRMHPDPVYWNAHVNPLQVPWDCLGRERCKACLTMVVHVWLLVSLVGTWIEKKERMWLRHNYIIPQEHRIWHIWPYDLFLAMILRIKCFWMQPSSLMHMGHYTRPVKELGVFRRDSNWIDAYEEHVHFCCPVG